MNTPPSSGIFDWCQGLFLSKMRDTTIGAFLECTAFLPLLGHTGRLLMAPACCKCAEDFRRAASSGLLFS
jgi:hypothetical protein